MNKNTCPKELEFLNEADTLRELLVYLRKLSNGKFTDKYIECWDNENIDRYCRVNANQLTKVSPDTVHDRMILADAGYEDIPLYWFDRCGRLWESYLHIIADIRPEGEESEVSKFWLSSWKQKNKYFAVTYDNYDFTLLNSDDELEMVLLSSDPESYAYIQGKSSENGIFSPVSLLLAPQIRLLDEWGFKAFSEDDGSKRRDEEDFVAIAEFTRSGNTPDEVFPVPIEIYEDCRNCNTPREWLRVKDSYERMKRMREKEKK